MAEEQDIEFTISPEIHHKCIYMWNDSQEHLLNAGNGPQTPQGQENLHMQLGKAKKKKREKGIRTGPVALEGVVKEERSPCWQEISWDRGGAGALEESMVAGVQRASRESPARSVSADRTP